MKSSLAGLDRLGGLQGVHVGLYVGGPAEWDDFVSAQPEATASHQYAWKRIVRRVYGHDCPYLAARDENGLLTGVLPLVDVRSILFGRFLVSMPFLNGGGPLGSPESVQALANAAQKLATARRADLLELRCGATPMSVGLDDDANAKVGCVLPLRGSVDDVWHDFSSKLRSQIRRAQKENIEVVFGSDQCAPFFGVFERNMRDLGSPVHRPQFFTAIADELKDTAWFGCAYYNGKAVAAGCALQFGSEVEMTWASSLREFNAIAPNMLLYWSFIARAAELGLQRFNFGRSTPNTGTHRFKQQWGSSDAVLHWYRSPAGAGAVDRDSAAMSWATRVWQHLPLPVATTVGGRLRGGIPA